MQHVTIAEEGSQLVIRPTAWTLAAAYGFLVVFGGAALGYSVGLGRLVGRINNFAWWEAAFVLGMPLVFALVLASWVWENRRPFRLDRNRKQLFDGASPVLSLDAVRAVAVRLDPGETADFFAIDLVLGDGKTYCLRRHWWPMDSDQPAALSRAGRIAEFLGVELRDASGTVIRPVPS